MDLEDFMAASFALLAEEHQRINPLKDLLTLTEELAPEPTVQPRVKTTVVDAQNQESLAKLGAMMKGVKTK